MTVNDSLLQGYVHACAMGNNSVVFPCIVYLFLFGANSNGRFKGTNHIMEVRAPNTKNAARATLKSNYYGFPLLL